jgi:hypothetical protein
MEFQSINWLLVTFYLFNIGLAVVWIILMLRALGRVDEAPLQESQRLIWAVVIVTVPIIGAMAFLAAYPGKKANGKVQKAE